MKRIVPKHSLVLRWTHWVNFPILTLMIWSGFLIYWANPAYRIGWGDATLFKFFPKSWNEALGLPFRLAEGMAFHFAAMWLFMLNGLVYMLYTFFSGEWRHLLPNRHSFREAWLVLLHDLKIRKTPVPQTGKYNAAQRVAYSAIILMGIGSVVTGFAIYKPVQLSWLIWLCGGYEWARAGHFILTIGYCGFFVIHVVQVALAGWNNFRSMVTGFEVVKVPDSPVASAPAGAAQSPDDK